MLWRHVDIYCFLDRGAILTSVRGSAGVGVADGRPAAHVKSEAKRRIEKWFILLCYYVVSSVCTRCGFQNEFSASWLFWRTRFYVAMHRVTSLL